MAEPASSPQYIASFPKIANPLFSYSMKNFLLLFCLFLVFTLTEKNSLAQQADLSTDTVLYTMGYAHLDTQWRWDYRTTIDEYLKNTLLDNFKLFEKYPGYVFNFSGANRYKMMKEYYPAEYARLKTYVAAGRWFPCGSSIEENDVLAPSAESVIRQVLYGNSYFRKEFGKASTEFMLPDCFGFPAGLPTILSYCGIKGFSTQKLTWGSAVGIPFNIGRWIGPDGASVVAVLNPGSYTSNIVGDLNQNKYWKKRILDQGKKTGIYCEYLYFGTGDMGGAPEEKSVQWLQKSLDNSKNLKIISGPADRMFNDLKPSMIRKLPTYKGEFLLTNHSAGSISSHTYMKRWNRSNEALAYKSELASVIAGWLGGPEYPQERLNEAWRLVLGSQFHDILPGTSIPKAYEFAWNDELLAQNQFGNVFGNAVASIARTLNTDVEGIPVLVFNSLAREREDIVEASVSFAGKRPEFIRIYTPQGTETPSQITAVDGNTLRFIFLARVPSAGCAIYDVRPSEKACGLATGLSVKERDLENERYSVSINEAGDVSSIFDKQARKELLSAPSRLAFQYEKPEDYPAWNMDWNDQKLPPSGYVDGKPIIRITENGPVRVSLEVERESRGSRFVQQVRLLAGSSAGRVEFNNHIDWISRQSALKAVFPLTVSNPLATYNTGMGTVQRGNNDSVKYEVPDYRWLDLTNTAGDYGVSFYTGAKYGSDKPADNQLRLTLLYTPGTRSDFKDQATLDFGKHDFLYALFGHAKGCQEAGSNALAERLDQPLVSFTTARHEGNSGRTFSFLSIDYPSVSLMAVKKAETNDVLIVRLQETSGQPVGNASLKFAVPVTTASEVNGQEFPVKQATIRDGKLLFDIAAWQPMSFALKLAAPASKLENPGSRELDLPFNADGYSFDSNKSDGDFDGSGKTIPAELVPDQFIVDGIPFKTGPKTDGQKNILICRGQGIQLPAGKFNSLYILAASADSIRTVTFKLDGKPFSLRLDPWSGFIGQWDKRKWDGNISRVDYEWNEANYAGIEPGYVRQAEVALHTTHRHLPGGANDPYAYTYAYKYFIPLPAGAQILELPTDAACRILSVTVANSENEFTRPAQNLSDTLNYASSGYERFQPCSKPRIYPESNRIPEGAPLNISMSCADPKAEIRYTLDGSVPLAASALYSEPIPLSGVTVIKAMAFSGDRIPSSMVTRHFSKSYPVSKVQYLNPVSEKYPGSNDDKTLIDGQFGTGNFYDASWQGIEVKDFDLVFDLGESKPVHKISFNCLVNNGGWIYAPEKAEIGFSDDAENFRDIIERDCKAPEKADEMETRTYSFDIPAIQSRFVHLRLKNIGNNPAWHSSPGGKAWLFLDEVTVE